MMVVFQEKIIYMPGLPPNSRRETIAGHASGCGGVQWREHRVQAADGTQLALAVATVPLRRWNAPAPAPVAGAQTAAAHVYVLYFQGNASSTPPRLPDLSLALRTAGDGVPPSLASVHLTFICLSYRGYWTSQGRPSERGIRLDAEAAARWVSRRHEEQQVCEGPGEHGPQQRPAPPVLLLWGQSIGGGVATNLAATGSLPAQMPVRGLILETPFLSVRAMLETVYPQMWLPYRYLWPFLRSRLDSGANLGLMAARAAAEKRQPPGVFILEAGRDELVPEAHGATLHRKCLELGIPAERAKAAGAYHSEVMARAEGKRLAAGALLRLTERALSDGCRLSV